jgi:hypothetical protein
MLDKIVTGLLPGFPAMLGFHRFTTTDAGELAHYTGTDPIADELRAIVPPEGWADYCEQWPEARSIVDQLKRPPPAPADGDMLAVATAAAAAALKAAGG